MIRTCVIFGNYYFLRMAYRDIEKPKKRPMKWETFKNLSQATRARIVKHLDSMEGISNARVSDKWFRGNWQVEIIADVDMDYVDCNKDKLVFTHNDIEFYDISKSQ